MAYKTLSARFPLRKLHRKEVFKKMRSAAAGARQAGGVPDPRFGVGAPKAWVFEQGISRRGK